jgi:hypothetical protein
MKLASRKFTFRTDNTRADITNCKESLLQGNPSIQSRFGAGGILDLHPDVSMGHI